MTKEFAFMLLEEDCVDEKGNWDVVYAQLEDNEVTISCVLLGEHEGEVGEFTITKYEYMNDFRGLVDLDDGMYQFQRYQYDTLMEKYFK